MILCMVFVYSCVTAGSWVGRLGTDAKPASQREATTTPCMSVGEISTGSRTRFSRSSRDATRRDESVDGPGVQLWQSRDFDALTNLQPENVFVIKGTWWIGH